MLGYINLRLEPAIRILGYTSKNRAASLGTLNAMTDKLLPEYRKGKKNC